MNGKYQEFDPLTPEEFAALERSILDRGVDVPIILDEDGNVLDGHHRLSICKKHDITDYPTTIKSGLSEDAKRDLAQTLNMARRSLSREQRQNQIRNRLKRNPEHSDRMIAQALGVDHKTVGSVRKKMESGGEVPHVDRKVGRSGMPYTPPSKPKMTDFAGGEIPQRLEKVFACRTEHTSLSNIITELRRRAGELAERSPLHEKVTALNRCLTTAQTIIDQTSPHAIHGDCGGEGCNECGDKGYLMVGEIPQP